MTQAFRILQITDTHLLGDPAAIYRGWQVSASLQAVIEHIQAHEAQPDAILLTGDLSQDETNESYALLRSQLAPLPAPLWALPGNHDAATQLQATLQPELYLGHVDIPGWRVILLNTQQHGETAGRLSESELRRLEHSLQNCPANALVVTHHPAFDVGSQWLDNIGLTNKDALLDTLKEHSQVRLLLCGHIHQQWDSWLSDIHLLGSPSTCRQFLPGSENFSEDAQAPGYRWLELAPDGSYQTRVERVPRARLAGLQK